MSGTYNLLQMVRKNNEGIFVVNNAHEALSYPDEGNDFCFEVEDKSSWFTHRNKIIESAIKRFPFENNFTDIGGGNGFQVQFFESKFPNRKFYLVEPSYLGCRNAKKRGLSEVYCMSFKDFPFQEKKIGGIGLFDVIEHIEDDKAFLQQLASVTPKGTILYLTTPAYQALWSDVDEFSGHYRRYTKPSIERALIDSNWQPVFISYFFKLLPPFVWTMRCLPYKIRGSRNASSIKNVEQSHHKGGFLEKLLFGLQSKEPNTLLKQDIRFGSSLIVVATNK